MKRSEFEEIINAATAEAMAQLHSKIKEASEKDDVDVKKLIADMYVEGLLASARATANIIEKLNLIVLTDD